MADDKLVEIMRDATERTLLRWLFVGQSADYMFSASDALARAALAAVEGAGYRVVPVEPTEEMLAAVGDPNDYPYGEPYSTWKAMLAAAPRASESVVKESLMTDAGWEPMETAPGEGAAILGYQAVGNHAGRMAIVWRWGRSWRCADYPDFMPTHWRPLPAPPEGRT